MKSKRIFIALALLFLLYSCKTLAPLAPESTPPDVPEIIQPVSNVEVPVTAELKSYFVQAENSVPVKYSDNQQPCQGLRYNYTFNRTPFTITGANNVFSLKFVGSYGFTASYCAKCSTLLGSGPQCVVPTVSAECGVGEPLRRMEISYQSTITVLPDYHLKSATILSPVPRPIDRCNVFMGNIDVTDRLINYLKDPLGELGKQVDARIAAYNIKPMVEQMWNNIAGEYNIADVGYLYINPQTVRLSSFRLNGSKLLFSVGFSAKPVVVTTREPQPVKPLPNLTSYVPAKGFNVYLDVLEKYDHLSHAVNQEIAGQNIQVAGKQFILDSARVYGSGTKIVMKIDFSGSSAGTIYLLGTPTYDPVKHDLSFPDLSFDLHTKAWMLKAAKWMFNGKITDIIRQRATYHFTTFIADSKTRLQKELSKDYGNGIRSDVAIQDLDILAIYPTTNRLIIRTLSTGQLKVKVVM